MKYCANCGDTIEDNEATICNNCDHPIADETIDETSDAEVTDEGAEESDEGITEESTEEPVAPVAAVVEPAAEPKGRKPLSSRVKIAIACVVGVVLLATAGVAMFLADPFADPVDRFRDIQRQSIFEPLANASDFTTSTDVFSTDIIITAGIESNDLGIAMISNILSQFAIELAIDMDTESSMIDLAFSAFGDTVMSAAMLFSDEMFGAYIPSIGAHYIIDMPTLLMLMGGDFDLATYATFDDWTGDEYSQMILQYADILLSAVNADNLTTATESVSLFDGGRSVRATVYTFVPSEDDLRDVLATLVETIRDDDAIFAVFATQFDAMMSPLSGWNSAEDQWASLFDDPAILAEIDAAAAFLADNNFTWRSAATRSQLILQEISFDVDGETFAIRYEGYGSGSNRTDWITLDVFDDGFLSLRNESSGNRNALAGTLVGYFRDRGPAIQFMTVTYDLNRNTSSILGVPHGTYTIEAFDGWGSLFSLSLDVSAGRDGGTDHLLGIHNMQEFGFNSLTLNIHSTDVPSTIDRPTQAPIDLSGLSLREIEDIFEELLFLLQFELAALLDVFNFF